MLIPFQARAQMRTQRLVLICAIFILSGCEQLGLDDGTKAAAAKEADGKAIGGACRHSGRALEDCYILNPKALKAAVFAGWRDMDGYMRENKIENATPTAATKAEESKATETKSHDTKAAEDQPAEANTSDKNKPAKH